MRARVCAKIREHILILWGIEDYGSKKCLVEDEFWSVFEITDEAIVHDAIEGGEWGGEWPCLSHTHARACSHTHTHMHIYTMASRTSPTSAHFYQNLHRCMDSCLPSPGQGNVAYLATVSAWHPSLLSCSVPAYCQERKQSSPLLNHLQNWCF